MSRWMVVRRWLALVVGGLGACAEVKL